MQNFEKSFKHLKNHASQNFIPIIRPLSSEILEEFILKTKPKRILEIGTATGYSALLMLKNAPFATLLTIEKDPLRLEIAKQMFDFCQVSNRVEVINGDANEIIKNLEGEFDFVFLDGPKSHYLKQLPFILKHLKIGGIIFADNVLFMGAVLSGEYPSHKHRTAVFRMREFLEAVKNDTSLESELKQIEDGILIIKKIK